ncbi:MAG: hypothetical protein ACREL5_04540 [Gemmatimonadales bacterium]
MISHTAARLGPTRDAALAVHRALLATERIAWESLNGRVADNSQFLHLVIHDPWFAWLRPMTALLAAMDELMVDRSDDAGTRCRTLLGEVRALLRPDENGDDFQQRYFEFVQRSPDVAVAHGVLMRELNRATA